MIEYRFLSQKRVRLVLVLVALNGGNFGFKYKTKMGYLDKSLLGGMRLDGCL